MVRIRARIGARMHSLPMTETSPVVKRATNLTLNGKVLDAARELGMNISQTVDELLAREVRRRQVEKWAVDHARTVEAYNQRVQDSGLWNDDLRKLRGEV